jgi:hypothetical protein
MSRISTGEEPEEKERRFLEEGRFSEEGVIFWRNSDLFGKRFGTWIFV